jgi:hypothetical protein
MPTLAAQAGMSICVVAFALLALLIARRVPHGQPVFRYAWGLTGAAFLVRGLNSLFHDVFSTLGFLGGEGSPAWNAVLAWHAILNHSRTFELIAYCFVFLYALVRASRGRAMPRLSTSMAIVVGGMVVGGLIGWQEDTFTGLSHFPAVAVWDVVAMFVMFGILFVGILTSTLDRGLWACLSIYTFILAMSALAFAFLSRIDVIGEWAPSVSTMQIIKALLYVGLNAAAIRVWLKVRSGKRLRPFIEERTPRSAGGPSALPSLAASPSLHR